MATFLNGGLRDENLGIGSYTVKDWRATHRPTMQDSADRNTGLQDYCTHVLNKMMLPSGRVQLFERSEHFGDGRIRSRDSGKVRDVLVRRRIVDATQFPETLCKSFIPCFSVAPGVNVVRPIDHDAILNLSTSRFDTFCVLGGGRTGTEMVLTLLDLGVSSDSIRWVKSRDPWMLAATSKPEQARRSDNQISNQQECLKAMAYAQNQDDLCLRLESLGVIVRTSDGQMPSYFLPHLVTHHDAERLQQVHHVIRKGHVHAISEIGMLLSHAVVPMPEQSLYLDCTGHGGTQHAPNVVFQNRTIDLAEIRLCHPSFSAAITAAIELLDISIEEKNKLCVPTRGHHIAELFLTSLLNQHAWLHDSTLRTWLERCPLDSGLQTTAQRLNRSRHMPQDLGALRAILPRAIINLESMVQKSDPQPEPRL
ncbi:MAG: hypothetical protein AAFR82_00240 [Pseudomonadota bacterium]